MKTIGYDKRTAQRLVPLLRSIVREICDRRAEVEQLRPQFGRLSGTKGPEFYDTRARLAANQRGLRLALKELARLGCELDPLLPTLVHIPGESGSLEDGFAWIMETNAPCLVPLQLAG